jgi:hypothetical protein
MVKPETLDRICILVGLCMVIGGLAWLSPPVAVAVAGALLLVGGLEKRRA